MTPEAEIMVSKIVKKCEVKVVYPLYQYGEYKNYDPEHGNYYLPGSSVKGALQRRKSMRNHLMADDVLVSNSDVVLRTLWKAQYLEGSIWCEYQVHRNVQGDSHQNKCDIVKKVGI